MFLLIISVLAIILLSSYYKINTFVVLIGAAFVVGILSGQGAEDVLNQLKTGFGKTNEKIGLLIILGTILGGLLERSKATLSIAHWLLQLLGNSRMALAITLMGFMVGLPIFCDSGFIVLIGLVLALVQTLGHSHLRLVLCLANALFAVHCLVPPHPGITAATGILNADTGKVIMLGVVLAIVPTIVGYFWAKYSKQIPDFEHDNPIQSVNEMPLPKPFWGLMAIFIPILLIAFKSIVLLNSPAFSPLFVEIIKTLGEPLLALTVGILLTIPLFTSIQHINFSAVAEDAIVKAGPILAIVGAGGAFGEVIKHLKPEQYLSGLGGQVGTWQMLVIPFAIAAFFKIAQGSSTVAVMSAATLVGALFPVAVGSWEQALILAAMGAGSMTFSHANDAYFWVVARFGKIDTNTMLRAYTPMTLLMGLSSLLFLLVIQWLV